MRRLLVAGVLVFTACARDAALKLVITTAAERPDSCFEVTVASTAGDALATATLPRTDGGTAFEAIINQGGFPDDVTLSVKAWVADGGCAEPRIANGALSQPAHFAKGLTTVEAKLEQLTDDDADFAVAAEAGGADCNDTDAMASPFLAENCALSADADCDGFVRCADTDCATVCQNLPTKLVFTTAPLTVQRAECSSALHLEAQTSSGAPVALPSGLTLSADTTTITFSSASDCSGVAPTSLPAGGLSLYVLASQLGTFTLTAAAPGLTSATQELEVVSVPHVTLFTATNPVVATTCTMQALQLYDADGSPHVSGTPVTVTFDAGAPFSLFDDCTSRQALNELTLTGVSSTVFGFSTPRAGNFTLIGSAPGFAAGVVTYPVEPGPAFSVQVDAGEPLLAATCNAISLSWTDDAGNVTAPDSLALTSTLPIFTDSTCSVPGTPNPTQPATAYVWPGDEGTYAFSVDAGDATADVMLTAVRPFPAGAVLELPLSVHTGGHAPFNGYNGYSTLVLIDAGAPLPDDLSLLRAYFWDVNGWRELDRVYGDADNDQKQFWFRSQTDLGNDITDTHYAFFVMATGTPPAKANQDNVWLFVDDFEGGLGKWGDGGSQWALGTNGGLTSTNNLTNLGNDAGTELTISPLVPLHERDVSVQSWWKSPNFDNVNAAQQLRVQPASAGATWLGHEVNKAGTQWQTATYAGPATYTYLANVSGGAMGQMQDGWSLVLLRMCGNLMEAQTPSGYWSQTLGSAFDAGTVSFRSSGSTHAPVMIDNVVVRRYACPEPQTSVLPSRTSP